MNTPSWAVPVPKETLAGLQSGFSEPDVYAIDGRAIMYHFDYFSAKHLGQGQFYVMAIHDAVGRPLDGKKNYKLAVPAKAPVQQYWSATIYDAESHGLIRETSHSSRASNVPDIKSNPDGSFTIYFVPTNGRPFEVLFRLYGPEKSFFDNVWTLPDIEAIAG